MIPLIPYLHRIGAQIPQGNPLQSLHHMQYRQVRSIPFENLNILWRIPLTMDVATLYTKLITERRGGVCYELNGFFHHVLTQLGYTAQLHAATVHHDTDWYHIDNTHMFNVVTLDGEAYLVDVGFGGQSPSSPVPMNGEEVADIDGAYRVITQEGYAILQKNEGEHWKHLYRFERVPRREEEFEPFMRFIEQSPESHFNKKPFLTMVKDTGRVTISGNSLTQVEQQHKVKTEITAEALAETIVDHFGMPINRSITW